MVKSEITAKINSTGGKMQKKGEFEPGIPQWRRDYYIFMSSGDVSGIHPDETQHN